MPDLLFVYGTLKRQSTHPMATMLAASADYLGDAQCLGRLYDLGRYPGLILSAEPSDVVLGDLFRLRDAALLDRLDAYEGCGLNDPLPHPYVRAAIDVAAADGVRREAWTYIYQSPVEEYARIASGRYQLC